MVIYGGLELSLGDETNSLGLNHWRRKKWVKRVVNLNKAQIVERENK